MLTGDAGCWPKLGLCQAPEPASVAITEGTKRIVALLDPGEMMLDDFDRRDLTLTYRVRELPRGFSVDRFDLQCLDRHGTPQPLIQSILSSTELRRPFGQVSGSAGCPR